MPWREWLDWLDEPGPAEEPRPMGWLAAGGLYFCLGFLAYAIGSLT